MRVRLPSRMLSGAMTAAATLAIPLVLSGCAGISHGGPPLVVCGTTLSRSAGTPVLVDVSKGGLVTFGSLGGDIFLKVSAGCSNGAVVSWEPASAASRVAEARADDGQAAAIVLHPNDPRFTIDLSHGTQTIEIPVDLTQSDPPSPPASSVPPRSTPTPAT